MNSEDFRFPEKQYGYNRCSALMAALSPPKRVTIAFVSRSSGNIHKRRTFEFRNEFQAILKIAAWVSAMIEEGFTPEKYRIIAYVDTSNGKPDLVTKILEKSGIEVHVDRILGVAPNVV